MWRNKAINYYYYYNHYYYELWFEGQARSIKWQQNLL